MSAFSQDHDYVSEMENYDLKIRQRPGTERLLANYFNDKLSSDDDTVYAILYRPSSCLRCEVGIPNFYRMLKANSKNNKMLLVSVYENAEVSKLYNEKKKYKADGYVYDTDDSFKKIFSLNTEDMMGLYILKVSIKNGRLISGGNFTVLGKSFVSQLVRKHNAMEAFVFAENTESERKPEKVASADIPTGNVVSKHTDLPVMLPHDFIVSTIYGMPQYDNGNFAYSDMLWNGVVLCENKSGKLSYRSFIQADSSEINRFVFIPRDMFEERKRLGMIFYICLQPKFTEGGILSLSYSLPKAILEANNKGVALYNAPVILQRDLSNLSLKPMFSLDFDLDHSKYFYMHFDYDIFNHKAWMGCEKLTWPMDDYSPEDYKDNIELNPFDARFYDTFNPVMASFRDTDGRCDGLYGHLERSQQLSRTGYYFLNSIFSHNGRELLYSNGYTGVVYVADSSRVGKDDSRYIVFDIPDSCIPVPDSSMFYKREYGMQFDAAFNRCIVDAKFDDNYVYCLVRYGMPRVVETGRERYCYVVVDRHSGKRREYVLPANDDSKVYGWGLGTEKKTYFPFVFLKSRDGCLVRMYKI